MLKFTKNFDWSITRRKIVVFIPNFNRAEQVRFGIWNMITHLPKDDWVIIIGNDNCYEDFSDMKEHGAYFFSLDTGQTEFRNSAFIRNYAIKRCRSQYILQKDPEVFLNGDYLTCVSKWRNGWKAGYVLSFPKGPTREIMNRGVGEIFPYLKHHVPECPLMSGDFLKQDLGGGVYRVIPDNVGLVDSIKVGNEILSGKPNISNWLSYALAIETKVLHSLNGYDEDFTNYGYEDSDMFCRLMKLGYPIYPDYRCTSIHLHHPSTVDDRINDMEEVFARKQKEPLIRNVHDGIVKWGEGR